jgi:hypothetical protein
VTLLIVILAACNLTAPTPPRELACFAPELYGPCRPFVRHAPRRRHTRAHKSAR